MGHKDSNQHRVPGNTPDRKTSEPKMPGEESEDIRKGARQEDQLDKLQPESQEDKAPGQIGAEPVDNPGENDPDENNTGR